MLLYICSAVFLTFILLWLIILSIKSMSACYRIENKHVFITGGSSGIGINVAIASIKKHAACVTIVARNQMVQQFSLDVSSGDLAAIQAVVDKAESGGGPVDVLINCAGTSLSKPFTQTSHAEFKKMMDVNYYGTVHMCQCVIGGMIRRNSGRLVLTSSVAGHVGLYGYSAYSASKFALRGLAECLQMEVQPYDIKLSLVFPPDTDTPGYKLEQLEKPEETQLISEYGGLFQAEQVADVVLSAVEHGRFLVPVGFDGWVMSSTATGLTTAPLHELMAQVLLSGIFRVVALFYLHTFNSIVKACHKRRRNAKDTDGAGVKRE